MVGEVEVFRKHIEGLPEILARTQTAADILHDPYGAEFCAKMGAFRECLKDELCAIQAVFEKWQFHLESTMLGPVQCTAQIGHMVRINMAFVEKATEARTEMQRLLNEEVGFCKSKIAQYTQKKQDKNGISAILGQKIATQKEALESLDKMKTIVNGIQRFSTELNLSLTSTPGMAFEPDNEVDDKPTKPHFKQAFSVDLQLSKSALNSLKIQIMRLDNPDVLSPPPASSQ
jgi:hypothetical protein